VNLRENHEVPARFDVSWTPTVLIMDPDGTERHRIEGYLPNREFRAQLELGLARSAFKAGRFDEAEKRYDQLVRSYEATPAAPEALYWRAVSRYKGTGDPSSLGAVADELAQRYPGSEWATRASIWKQPAAA
jgi:outer membrane protein assembly factor BamD (BamD/ComL family)